ncbi:PAS domain-containing methyl-accepting chemotaxis protein [Thiomicrospira sp. ALE5]|uniref:methyl-accepting chemotaxis protein n=1 Tax=Thiomicrospira sp. ALE5 TaxID=748650 RepID=UPI0008ED531F|nr:PAS domain-containing methyl-accepting chemotaxis protein [Thiomicrospira sp. ALE5]SFR53870.1 methyl-accepting chemotaxis sensory transducer with Pas/Pac sensor [Thiomicrospira sp. ALE5]
MSGQEYKLSAELVILSTADLHGTIIDYNAGFKEASGYSDEELKNQPHSILRHPDMPKEAFKDFWDTIQAGLPWQGMVKNKRKNGDYYWVSANACPIFKDGKITSYLSVRYPATEEQKQWATQLYADVKAGKVGFPWTPRPSKQTEKAKLTLPLLAGLGGTVAAGVTIAMTGGLLGLAWLSLPVIGLSYLAYQLHGKQSISATILKGIEDINNSQFRNRINDNSELGFMMNLIRSRVAESAARNYDALRASQELTTALNAASTNIMVADGEFNIKSINKSLREMFTRNEAQLKQALPNFDATRVVGSNMDIFHQNPAHQRAMVGKMVEPWTGELRVAGLVLRLTVVPIKVNGEKTGYVVEWLDRTQEANITDDIVRVMSDMNHGRFDSQVTAVADGVLKVMKGNINGALSQVNQAVSEISTVLEAQSKGDLTQQLPENAFKGQMHDLENAINYAADRLKEVVGSAIEAAQVVSDASAQVSQGANDLSERVQSQAAALEQTSATMHQMSSAIENTSQNSRRAAELSLEVKSQSTEGAQVMEKTLTAMQAIEESSHKIADIVSLIDSIAFQTNLLALNAAVEAARAGEHGRGFAVVAGEVRALAQKSAEASKEIRGLIDASVERVGNGTQLAQKSGDYLNQITQSIEEMADMIQQIADASAEQSQGIAQVHEAITQIDAVTQQNAALVEETTAAADTLDSEATNLRNTMAYFKTGSQPQALAENTTQPAKPRLDNKKSAQAALPKTVSPASRSDEWAEF